MAKLGDLYFDVKLNDLTDSSLTQIKNKLIKELGFIRDVRVRIDPNDLSQIKADIKRTLSSEEFTIKINVGQANVNEAVRAALSAAGLGMTAEMARAQRAALAAAESQAKIARQDAESQAKIAKIQASMTRGGIADAAAGSYARLKYELDELILKYKMLGEAERNSNTGTRMLADIERLRTKLREIDTALKGTSRSISTSMSAAGMRVREIRTLTASQIPILGDLLNMARNYVGVFGAVSFVRSLYRIRGEFERQQVALKALMQSAVQAREAFGQLQNLALKSPYQVSEIISFAKQLSAFSIPNKDLVETTKRLGDLAAGLGVDMSRIILAYGQVKAATVLRGQELRQFTEAGIPMVERLATLFSQMEGRAVSAAEVFERISKKQVSFENVKQVLDEMTDEGGRFYNHQEKMVGTLYGKVARMGDAWKVMLNNIGQANDSLLKWPVDAITNAMRDWRSTIAFIVSAFSTRYLSKGFNNAFRAFSDKFSKVERIATLLPKQLTVAQQRMMTLRLLARDFSAAIGSAIVNIAKFAVVNGAIFAIMDLTTSLYAAHSAAQALNEEMRGMGKDLVADVSKWKSENTKWITNLFGDDSTIEDQVNAWEKFRQELESLDTSGTFVDKLISIKDLEERNRAALNLLDSFEKIGTLMQNQNWSDLYTTSAWHGILGDGLNDDAEDFLETLSKVEDKLKEVTYDYENMGGTKIDIVLSTGDVKRETAETFFADFSKFNAEIDKTAENMMRRLTQALQRGASDEEIIIYFNKMRDRILAENANLYGDALMIFDTSIRRAMGDASGDLFRILDSNFDSFYLHNNANLTEFLSRVRAEAKKTGVDINDELLKGNTKTLDMLADNVVNKTKWVTQGVKDDIEKLRQYLLAHPGEWQIIFKFTTDSAQLTNYQKGLAAALGMSDEEFNKVYKNVMSDLTDEKKSVPGLRKGIGEANVAIKANTKAIERLKKSAEGNTEKALQTKASIVSMQRQNAELNKQIDAYNKAIVQEGGTPYYGDGSDLDSKGGYKSNRGGSGGSKKDAWLEAIKDRMRTLKDAHNEYVNLVKSIGATKAEKTIVDIYGEGVMDSLPVSGYKNAIDNLVKQVSDRIKQIPAKMRPAYDTMLRDLKKEQARIEREIVDNNIKQLQTRINNAVDIATRNWNIYDKLFEATGDERYSSFAAFGGERMVKNYIEQLKQLAETELADVSGVFGSATVSKMIQDNGLLAMTAEDAKEAYGITQPLYDLLKKIADLMNQKTDKFFTDSAKAISDMMTIEQKIAALEAKRAQLWKDNPIIKDGKFNAAVIPGLFAQSAAIDKQIADLKSDGLKLTEWWRSLTESTANDTLGLLGRKIKRFEKDLKSATKRADGTYEVTVTYVDEKGNEITKKEIINENTLKSAMDSLQKLRDQMKKDNITDWFFGDEGLGKAWKDSKGSGEKIELLGMAIGKAADAAKVATGPMKSFFEAIGDSATADAITLVEEQLDAISSMATGVGRAMSGDIIGGSMQAVGGLFSSIVSFFNFHDKRLERLIERSKREVKALENAYSAIEKAIERSMGSIYTAESGNAYTEMLTNLNRQYEELIKQRDWESDKKKKDQNALLDYNKQISELEDNIKHFAEDMAKSLYDIDVKSWARELTDAVVEAWAKGEDAAEAYKNKVRDIVRGLTKNILAQKVMETALEPVLDIVTNEMRAKSGKLDEATITKIAEGLGQAGETAVGTLTGILDKLKEMGYDLSDTSGGNTLGKGIASITEDTADLLASYLNAIRMDVSVIRTLEEAWFGGPIAQAQQLQMQAIAANTLRNAEAAERIESALNSVITVAPNGKKIRV